MSGAAGPPPWVEHTVGADEDGRSVGAVLGGALGFPRGEVLRLTRLRAIRLNGRRTTPAARVRAGDVVAAATDPEGAPSVEPWPLELRVVAEDDEVLVLDKPAGVLVHPVLRGQTGTLANAVAHRDLLRGIRARVHPVHRLDRDTSGLVLFARTPLAHRRLDEQLREHALRREYLALVHGRVPGDAGTIDAPLGRDPAEPARRAVRADGAPARTRFRVLESFADATLLRLELETGRTHQVRVHLRHLGHPVLGDPVYGPGGPRPIARQALHAFRLSLLHPATGAPAAFESPLPPDMAELAERLRAAP
ncbi:MAG: RluA family pseudouridine synthase [Gemmatimonadota bacterium]